MLYDRTGSGGPSRGVEVDDTDIYWCELTASDGNVVRAAPKNGRGPVRTLGKWYDFASGRSLVVDDRYVYWLRPEENGLVLRVDKDGSNATTLPLPPGPNGKRYDLGPLALMDDSVLVATHGCSTLIRVPRDGSLSSAWPVSSYPDAGGVTGIANDRGVAYCANGAHVHRLDLMTGAVTEMLNGEYRAGPISVVGPNLFFVSDDGNAVQTMEDLFVLRPEADIPSLVGRTFGSVGRLLHDEPRQTLYWVTGLHWAIATVAAYKLDSAGPPELLFENQDVMGSSAADADYLYWLSEHAVTRLRKWP